MTFTTYPTVPPFSRLSFKLKSKKNVFFDSNQKEKKQNATHLNKISKKDYFYQSIYFSYLFDQSKNSKKQQVTIEPYFLKENKIPVIKQHLNSLDNVKPKMTNFSLIANKELNQKISEICDKFNLYSRKVEFKIFNSRYSFISQPFFISYKKSFLSYWIICFAGLVASFPTLLKSPNLFLSLENQNILMNDTCSPSSFLSSLVSPKEDGKTQDGKVSWEEGINKGTPFFESLSSLPQKTFSNLAHPNSNEIQLILKKNLFYVNSNNIGLNKIKMSRVKNTENQLIKKIVSPESLILNYYNFYNSNSKNPLNIKNIYLDILLSKKKINSTFNWYSFTICHSQDQNQKSNSIIFEFPNKLFLANLFTLSNSQKNLDSPKNCSVANKSIKLENTLSKDNSSFLSMARNKKTREQSYLKSNNKIKFSLSPYLEKQILSNLSDNNFNLVISSNLNHTQELNKDKIQSPKFLNDIKQIEPDRIALNPIKSYEKASFFMDTILTDFFTQKNLKDTLLFKNNPFSKNREKMQENNIQNSIQFISSQKEYFISNLEKTLFFILKSKSLSSPSGRDIESSKLTGSNTELQKFIIEFNRTKFKPETEIINESKQNIGIFNITRNNYLYYSIFKGLKIVLKDFIRESIVYYKKPNLNTIISFNPKNINLQTFQVLAKNEKESLQNSSYEIENELFKIKFERLKTQMKQIKNYNLNLEEKNKFSKSILSFYTGFTTENTTVKKEKIFKTLSSYLISSLPSEEMKKDDKANINFSLYPFKLNNSIRGGNLKIYRNSHLKVQNYGKKIIQIFSKNLKTTLSSNKTISNFSIQKFIKDNKNLRTSHFYNSLPISKTGSKENIIKTNVIYPNLFRINNNSFKSIMDYIYSLKNSIEKVLDPYYYNSIYFPEFQIANLYKILLKQKELNLTKLANLTPNNKMKNTINISSLFQNNQPITIYGNKICKSKQINFEKIFTSSLSKLKKYRKTKIPNKKINSNFIFIGSKNKAFNFIDNIKLKTHIKLNSSFKSNISNIDFVMSQKNKRLNSKKNLLHKNNNLSLVTGIVLKNRLFVHKDIYDINMKVNKINLKKQNNKIKRRLKKTKKETRRRKKRKLFYPRPNWLTFFNYQKFLNRRYSLKNSNLQVNQLDNKKINLQTRQSLKFWILNQPTKVDLQLTKNTNSFYTISKNVHRDLKRLLIKSNWLKNHLNPYLNEIKILYKELKTNSQSVENFFNFRFFIMSMYGSLNNYNLFSNPNSTVLLSLPFENNKADVNRQDKKSPHKVNNQFQVTKISTEYYKIIYARIQNIISNIRENLNINGEFKNRSKNLNKNIRNFLKRDYRKTNLKNSLQQNQKPNFLLKAVKTFFIKLNKIFLVNYDLQDLSYYENGLNLSKNNLYWAINKSNILLNDNIYSSSRKLWEIYKSREIVKTNKTKKLVYNFVSNSKNFLFKTNNSLDKYSHLLKNLTIFPILSSELSSSNSKIDNNLIYFSNKITNIGNLKQHSNSKFLKINNDKTKNPTKSELSLMNRNPLDNDSNNVSDFKKKKNFQAIYTTKAEDKLKNIENKLNLLGISTIKSKNHYKATYFRFLKQQLFLNSSKWKNSLENKKAETNLKMVLLSSQSEEKSNNKNYFRTLLDKKNNTSGEFLLYQQNQNLQKIIKTDLYWWQPSNFDSIFDLTQEIKPLVNDISLSNTNFFNSNYNVSIMVTFLFHFSAITSLLSFGGIRTLIKFYYILSSKVFVTIYNIGFLPLLKTKSFSHSPFLHSLESKSSTFSIDQTSEKTRKKDKINKNVVLSLLQDQQVAKKEITNNSRILFYKNTLFKSLINRKVTNYLSLELLNSSLDSLLPSFISNSSNSKGLPLTNSIAFGQEKKDQDVIQQTNKDWTFIKFKLISFLVATSKKNSIYEFYNLFFKDFNLLLIKNLVLVSKSDFNSNFLVPVLKISPIYNSNQNKIKTLICGIKNSSLIVYSTNRLLFSLNLLLLKSVDFFSSITFVIYKFFEKPNEYVVENFAYSFLVEWSGDLITTIPQSVDTNLNLYFGKVNRSITTYLLTNSFLKYFYNSNVLNLANKTTLSLFEICRQTKLFNFVLFSLNYSFIKRFFNLSFINFVDQLAEPDSDYLNRKTKGTIFWEIWGENLKKVSDSNSINLYELSTDKEEQIKLLTKYEEIYNLEAREDKSLISSENKHIKTTFFNLIIGLSPFPKKNKNLLKITKEKQKDYNKILSSLIFESKFSGNKKNELLLVNSINKSSLAFQTKGNERNSWSINQNLGYQGKDSDLFIDFYPGTGFLNIPSIKYAYSIHQPLGSIVCQIFSGIFYKQISKNILVIGEQGIEKSIIIQAIAGETELKIITDNATRYATIYRGIAVGIKMLRDVFEALSVHSPCIFLLEDIHKIGERRPFLIDDSSSGSDPAYNKNQSMQGFLLKEKNGGTRETLYKINKHLLSNYRKPYKESRGFATNHFSFTFLYSNIFSKIRKTEIQLNGSGLALDAIRKEREEKDKNNQSRYSFSSNVNSKSRIDMKKKQNVSSSKNKLQSSFLSINQNAKEILSPPSLSPFNILILKEEKKLNYKKIVKEIPWFGVPGEQLSLISKYNYSVRVKVALLADSLLSTISTKLDMITDLLVIIDSVKGNRGFVVFGTTHVPSILDPALRRPGRFDETISLPIVSKLYSRWINSSYNFKYLTTHFFKNYWLPIRINKGITLDLFNSNFNFSSNFIPNLIDQIYLKNQNLPSNNILKTSIANYVNTKELNGLNKTKQLLLVKTAKQANLKVTLSLVKNSLLDKNRDIKYKKEKFKEAKKYNIKLIQIKAKNYSKACKFLVSLILYSDKKYISNIKQNILKYPNILKDSNNFLESSSLYLELFANSSILNKILIYLLSSKLGETFNDSMTTFKKYLIFLEKNINSENFETLSFNTNNPSMDTNLVQSQSFAAGLPIPLASNSNDFLFDFDNSWKYCPTLLLNFLQKQKAASFNKNLAFSVNKLLNFNNKYYLMQPGTPPLTNILLPSKRYENYKKSFKNNYGTMDLDSNFSNSISDKINLHHQQRLLKRLYKYPIKEFFRSEIVKNNNINNSKPVYDTFQTAYSTLIPLEKTNFKTLNSMSNVQNSYKNIIFNRHKTYFTNQWFNGQNGEHNLESTFLSDIDWRYTFVDLIGDVNIDFPDSEQYYNPRNRRWIITKGDWNHWFNFESSFKQIYSHHIYECSNKTYKYLDQHREIIDIYANLLNQKGNNLFLREIDILNFYKRFIIV